MPKGWKLQWAPTTEETAETAQDCDYFRIDETLVLIYARRRYELFSEADEHFLKAMTPEELEWLQECIDGLVRENARRHPEIAQANDRAFMEAFERELAKEKAMLEGKEEKHDGSGGETKGEAPEGRSERL